MTIPIGNRYSAIVSGSQLKTATCQYCEKPFHYVIERKAAGLGTSLLFLDNAGASDRAEKSAQHDLKLALATGIDPVPCPHCYLYQAEMVKLLRQKYHEWLKTTGGLLLLVALVGAFVLYLGICPEPTGSLTGQYWGGSMLVGGLLFGGTLLVLQWILAKNYDPNQCDNTPRQQLAEQRALTSEQLEKILADTTEQE